MITRHYTNYCRQPKSDNLTTVKLFIKYGEHHKACHMSCCQNSEFSTPFTLAIGCITTMEKREREINVDKNKGAF